MSHSGKVLAFIGSYAESDTPGVYACSYDPVTGELAILDSLVGLANPTFLTVSENRHMLYAITESKDEQGNRVGSVAAIQIAKGSGKLSLLDQADTTPAPTCHITLDRQEKHLIVSSYHGGMVGVSPIGEDGLVGAISDLHTHVGGSGVHPAQSQPRAHSAFIDAENRFVLVQDLGADRIYTYKWEADAGKLVPHGSVNVAAGAGPRHLVFHPTAPYAYVINELNATITAFAYTSSDGQLVEQQTVSTLPSGYADDNACADIHISPDGRYLYGSNRGHDSIVVFAIDAERGTLTYVDHSSSGGGHPRNFAISPDGAYLLSANRDSNNIVTYKRDSATGKLQAAGSELTISKPVCVKITGIPYQG